MNRCPYCDYVNTKKPNVDRHIRRMHPDKVGAPPPDNPTPPDNPAPPDGDLSGDNPQDFNLKTPESAEREYHCLGCGEKLTKGQTPCPGCGEDLAWDGID